MKRLIILLSSLALFGALTLGSTIVRADDGGGDDNAQCQSTATNTTSQTGSDRAIVADDRNGTQGDDNENGTAGDDNISGRAGDDDIQGDQGDDELCGDQGDDHLNGGPGNDDLEGGPGNDVLVGGKGHDILDGGRGRDRIFARDGMRDRINCGSGVDTVRADRADVVARNCEHVSR